MKARKFAAFAHLLVEALLGSANLPDALQQFIEVIPAAGFLEAGIVEDEALDEVFLQMRGGPLPKLGAARGTDAVADGEDVLDVQADVLLGRLEEVRQFELGQPDRASLGA